MTWMKSYRGRGGSIRRSRRATRCSSANPLRWRRYTSWMKHWSRRTRRRCWFSSRVSGKSRKSTRSRGLAPGGTGSSASSSNRETRSCRAALRLRSRSTSRHLRSSTVYKSSTPTLRVRWRLSRNRPLIQRTSWGAIWLNGPTNPADTTIVKVD